MINSTAPDSQICAQEVGQLDGFSVLRYAHMWRGRSSGGVEQYLNRLNSALLARQRMTIYQTYLTDGDASSLMPEIEAVEKGRIVWLPIPTISFTTKVGNPLKRIRFLDRHFPAITQSGHSRYLKFINFLVKHKASHFRYPVLVISSLVEDILKTAPVDLLVFHWMSYDAESLVKCADNLGVPFAIINHFDNKRLERPPVSRVLSRAAGIAGVSRQHVPSQLQDRYRNLSDAVDTDFFAFSSEDDSSGAVPAVLLPARLTPGKGHADLLQAASLLQGKVDFVIRFAGVSESDSFLAELKALASRLGLHQQVEFLGQLDQQGLREAYKKSAIVALPSGSEGLGRVLLEAQSMGRPVIAYASGGIPDALEHDKTGFLVPVGDLNQLSHRLFELLTNPMMRQSQGLAGRRYVEQHFSLERLVARHESFYLDASDKSRKR